MCLEKKKEITAFRLNLIKLLLDLLTMSNVWGCICVTVHFRLWKFSLSDPLENRFYVISLEDLPTLSFVLYKHHSVLAFSPSTFWQSLL